MAHREKDFEFVRALVDARLIDPVVLQQRLASIDLTLVQSDQDIDVLDYGQRNAIAWAAGLDELKRRAYLPTSSGALRQNNIQNRFTDSRCG